MGNPNFREPKPAHKPEPKPATIKDIFKAPKLEPVERASFALYNVDSRDMEHQFLEDADAYEAFISKQKAGGGVVTAEDMTLQARIKEYRHNFPGENIRYCEGEGPCTILRYNVLSIRRITNKLGVKTNTWKIEVDSKRAMEALTQRGAVVRFFGAEVKSATPWRDKP